MRKARRNIKLSKLILLFVICSFVICHCSFAQAKEYDGIWFMGMNLKHEVLQDQRVREAINRSIDKNFILSDILSEETTPVGFIPPGMLGYDPDLDPYLLNIPLAKLLMQQAGYQITDQRLKSLTLLHTDGILTVEIAKKIAADLRNIGIKATLVKVDYSRTEDWAEELASGKHDFFLMGYKAGVEELFSTTEASTTIDSYNLVHPLFASTGDVNFTGYSNPKVDELLAKVEGLNLALKSERHRKLKEINGILHRDLPAVILFYIEKL